MELLLDSYLKFVQSEYSCVWSTYSWGVILVKVRSGSVTDKIYEVLGSREDRSQWWIRAVMNGPCRSEGKQALC